MLRKGSCGGIEDRMSEDGVEGSMKSTGYPCAAPGACCGYGGYGG